MLVELATLKAYMGSNRLVDNDDDGVLTTAIQAAGTLINSMTGRTIVVGDGTSSDKVIYGTGTARLKVPDFTVLNSVTYGAIAEDPTTYQTVAVTDGEPFFQIIRGYPWYRSFDGLANYTVNAKWGWTAIPGAIQQACLILAKDIVANQKVDYGIVQFTEFASTRARWNLQVKMLLDPFDIRNRIG